MLDSLTLDQMRVLTAVAEEGSFSAAARRLGRVQSAVSQAIQAMETSLGLTLFDRSARTPTLTESGVAIVRESRAVLRRVHAMRARAASVSEGQDAELTLAVDAIFPLPPLIASLNGLKERFPDVPVTLFTEGFRGAEAHLKAGSARLAIFAALPGSQSEQEREFLALVRLVPVVAASHPLAAVRGPIAADFLREHVQLVLTERSPTAQSFSAGIVSDRLWRFADMPTRLEFLLAGFGWCRMPLHLIEPHLAAGRLVALDLAYGGSADVRVDVALARERPLGTAGRWLIADLREQLKTCPSTAPVDLPEATSSRQAS